VCPCRHTTLKVEVREEAASAQAVSVDAADGVKKRASSLGVAFVQPPPLDEDHEAAAAVAAVAAAVAVEAAVEAATTATATMAAAYNPMVDFGTGATVPITAANKDPTADDDDGMLRTLLSIPINSESELGTRI
jgi:acetylornithine deacetylase/succinyl-diaminopimelate desuccinylase-like protein